MKRFSRHALSMISAAALALAAAPQAGAQWSQHQGDAAHTGYAAGSIPASGMAKAWDWSDPAAQSSYHDYTPLAVSDQGVFVCAYEGSQNVAGDSSAYAKYGLTALNRLNGQAQWTTPVLSYAGTVSAPSLSSDTVYLDDFGHSGISGGNSMEYPQVVGINAANGQSRFATAFQGQWDAGSRPTVLGGQVVSLGGYYGGMDSYDATTGSHQWFLTMPQQYAFIPAMDTNEVYIYYGAASASPGPSVSTLYAISRTNGTVDYTIQNPTDNFTTYSGISSVALGSQNDALVIDNTGTNGPKQVTSFDLAGHTVRWNRALNAVNSLAVAGGSVFVPLQSSVHMIDETTGADRWTWAAPSGVTLNSNIVVTDSTVLVASTNTVYGIDRAAGQVAWSASLNTPSGAGVSSYSLAYYGNMLYASGAGHVIALSPASQIWTATALSVGGDNNARLLWDRSDGVASLWKLDAGGGFLANVQYGPYAGWTAKAIATGRDNNTRLLWTRADGVASFYLLDANNAFLSQQQYGPYAGWTPQNIAVAPDGTSRALWTNTNGTATVWTLDSANHLTGQQQFGPYSGWTARKITVAGDGTERLLWTNSDGTATFWHLSAQSRLIDQRQYPPYTGWTPQSITAAPDGTSRATWVNTDGHIAIWTLDASNNYTGQFQYGPYGGWAFTDIGLGTDGNARLLWNNLSRQSALWSLTPSGSFASNYQFGPY